MTDALRYEWVRIRTIRSTWWLSGIALVLGVGLAFVTAWASSLAFDSNAGPGPRDAAQLAPGIVTQFAFFGAPYVVGFVLAMIGVLSWGHEYRHGMIRATLTTLRSRTHAWLAKYVVVGLWVAVVTTLTLLGSALAGWAWLGDDGIAFGYADLGGVIARTLVYSVLLTWLAAALTSLVRNQTFALVLLFLWPLAVENLISLVFFAVPQLRDDTELLRFLPFVAGNRLLEANQGATAMFGEPLTGLGGGLVLGLVVAVLGTAGLWLFRRRDA